MEHTNYIDSPNYRHVDNNEDWLDEILAMELDTPSETVAVAGVTVRSVRVHDAENRNSTDDSVGALHTTLTSPGTGNIVNPDTHSSATVCEYLDGHTTFAHISASGLTCIYSADEGHDNPPRSSDQRRSFTGPPTAQAAVLPGCVTVIFNNVGDIPSSLNASNAYMSEIYWSASMNDVSTDDRVNQDTSNGDMWVAAHGPEIITVHSVPPMALGDSSVPSVTTTPSSTASAANSIIVCYPSRRCTCGQNNHQSSAMWDVYIKHTVRSSIRVGASHGNPPGWKTPLPAARMSLHWFSRLQED
ncbi:hypothetical protein LTR10_001343 [Elasticomyces elasticus]|nr:hypothetical protein LTR10_001343 [Elasticomyces elasticus]KAK4965293.1 hypothetical protein LTR42_012047 [Elasticomyces elasticus]